MPRHRRASWPLGLALVLGLAAVGSLALEGRTPRARAAGRPAARSTASPAALPAEPVLARAAPPPAAREAAVVVEPEVAPAPLRAPSRLPERLAELARSLEDPRGSRTAWEITVAATAGSLAPGDERALEEAAADPARAASVRVAAAELLRVLRESGAVPAASSLSPSALHALRAAARSPEPLPLLCAAASRSLAAFGGAAGQQELLLALFQPDPLQPDPEALRACAAFGLRSARGDALVQALVEESAALGDARARELALVTAEHVVRGSREHELSAPARERVARTLGEALADPLCAPAVALRGVTLLGALGGEQARAGLLGVLRDPLTRASVARSAGNALGALGPEAVRDLAAVLAEGEHSEERRLAVAEALARNAAGAAIDAQARASARIVLRRVAEQAGERGERERAMLALGELDVAEDLSWLAEVARIEDDPGVRAIAALAVERAAPGGSVAR